jgi:hypothetical protein
MRLLLALACSLLITGCGTPRYMTKAAHVSAPPADQALVNFHRPSSWGGSEQFNVWDGEQLVGFIAGNELIQYPCQPGLHHFVLRDGNVSVAQGEVHAGQVYDIVLDIKPGPWSVSALINPVSRDDERRPKLAGWTTDETPLALTDPAHASYVSAQAAEIRRIIDDFTTGAKRDRLHTFTADDHR